MRRCVCDCKIACACGCSYILFSCLQSVNKPPLISLTELLDKSLSKKIKEKGIKLIMIRGLFICTYISWSLEQSGMIGSDNELILLEPKYL